MDLREALRLVCLSEENDIEAEQVEAHQVLCEKISKNVSKLSKSFWHRSAFSVEDIVSDVTFKLMVALRRKPERLTTMVSDDQAATYIRLATNSAIQDRLRRSKRFPEYHKDIREDAASAEFTEPSDWQRRIESGVSIEIAVHDVLNEVWIRPGFPQPTDRTRQTIERFWNDFFRLPSGEVSEAELAEKHGRLDRRPRPNEVESFMRSFKRAREVVIDDLFLGEHCFGHPEAVIAKLEFIHHCWQRVPRDILEKSESRVKMRWPECP